MMFHIHPPFQLAKKQVQRAGCGTEASADFGVVSRVAPFSLGGAGRKLKTARNR